MKVSKGGNSPALKEGDEIEIFVAVAGERAFEVCRRPTVRKLLAKLRKFRGRLPAAFASSRAWGATQG